MEQQEKRSVSPNVMTVEDVMRETGLGRSKLYEMLAAGEIPAKRVGRRYVIRRELVFAWLEKGVWQGQEE